MTHSKVEEYLKRYRGITIYAACAMLIALSYGGAVLARKYGGKRTVSDLFECSCAKHLQARKSGAFRFVGGPPGNLFTVEGSLLVLLVDRLLYHEVLLEANALGY